MANEITAEMLAREMCRMDGKNPDNKWHPVDCREPRYAWHDYLQAATAHLLATRALASLQAERAKPVFGDLTVGLGKMQPKDAPERMRCWYCHEPAAMTTDEATAHRWEHDLGRTVTPGWFTAKGSTDD